MDIGLHQARDGINFHSNQVKEELAKRDADLAVEIAKSQAQSEEIIKKDEDLISRSNTITQLRNVGRKYKGLSNESEAKLKKVRTAVVNDGY